MSLTPLERAGGTLLERASGALLERASGTLLDRASGAWEFAIRDGLVVAHPDFEGLYFLNHTAGFIWQELRLGAVAEVIAQRFSEAFCVAGGISEDVARRDVAATLAEWERGMFRVPRGVAVGDEVTGVAKAGPGRDYGLNGKRFRLWLGSGELAAEIEPRLRHLEGDGAGPVDFELAVGIVGEAVELECGGKVFGREETVSGARAVLLQEMVRLAWGMGEWGALLHAGWCCGAGGCVVLPGASGAGKSTLAVVAGSAGGGMVFHSDDTVGVMGEGQVAGQMAGLMAGLMAGKVAGMPFGVAIREGSWGVVGARVKEFVGLEECERFGQRVKFVGSGVRESLAVAAVAMVFPRFVAGSGGMRVRELGQLEMLTGLQESGFWVPHTREGIAFFLEWVGGMPGYAVEYSEVDEVVGFLRGLAEK